MRRIFFLEGWSFFHYGNHRLMVISCLTRHRGLSLLIMRSTDTMFENIKPKGLVVWYLPISSFRLYAKPLL